MKLHHDSSPTDNPCLSTASEIIEEARSGRMFILVDDEERENKGDLVIPAQFCFGECDQLHGS